MQKSIKLFIEENIHRFSHLPSPQVELEYLVAFVLGWQRSKVKAFSETLIDDKLSQLIDLIDKRASGIPFAYLTQKKEFYGLDLMVGESTLVPRDDTEILVDEVLDKIKILKKPVILDLGTGSGAISLAIKHEKQDALITAVDKFEDSLTIALKNADKLQLAINFVLSDWFLNLDLDEKFDVIVSNPPYIDENDEHLAGDGVKFEPKRALVADERGYADLYHIIEKSKNYLKDGGWLMLEHGYNQGFLLREKMLSYGYEMIETKQDLGLQDRITIGRFIAR